MAFANCALIRSGAGTESFRKALREGDRWLVTGRKLGSLDQDGEAGRPLFVAGQAFHLLDEFDRRRECLTHPWMTSPIEVMFQLAEAPLDGGEQPTTPSVEPRDAGGAAGCA